MSRFGDYVLLIGAPIVIALLLFTIASWASRRVYRKIKVPTRRKIRGFLHQLEPLAFVATFIGLVASILALPRTGITSLIFEVNPDARGAQSLLVASAALLALLTFAATQMRSLEKDSDSSEKFFGVNKIKFTTSNSAAARILSLMMFRVAIALLFISPLTLLILNKSVEEIPILSLTVPAFKTQDVSLAVWGASFVLVGSTLIFNVLSSLKTSTSSIFFPFLVTDKIQDSLHEIWQSRLDQLLKDSKKSSNFREISTATSRRIAYAKRLPKEEHVPYLQLSFETWLSHNLKIDIRHKLELLAKHLEKGKHSPNGDFLGHVWVWAWQQFHNLHRNRALESLRKFSNYEVGSAHAMIMWLDSPLDEELQAMRSYLVSEIVTRAKSLNSGYEELRNSTLLSSHSTLRTDSSFVSDYDELVYCGPNAAPTFDRNSYSYYSRHKIDFSSSRKIERLTAGIYRSLCKVALSSWPSEAPSKISLDDLRSIYDSAERLSHAATREYVLRLLMARILETTTIWRSSEELLTVDTLAELLPYSPISLDRNDDGRESFTELTPNEISESVAFLLLLNHQHIDTTAREAGLAYVRGSKLPILLLYSLFYGVRSHRSLTVEDVKAFINPLDRFREVTPEEISETAEECKEIFASSSSSISHFVSMHAVQWLFQSLWKPLSLDLIVEFLEEQKQRRIVDFGLKQFIQWRLVAGSTVRNYFGRPKIQLTKDQTEILFRARKDLENMAEQWQSASQSAADQLLMLLHYFPSEDPEK